MAQGRILEAAFFSRPALAVARELIGKELCRSVNGTIVRAPIHETEAYVGPEDRACHAHRGRTARTDVMFGPPGRWYVYLCYGMHWMLNVVTGSEGLPAAVLLRGAGDFAGPGRLTRGLSITKAQNRRPASRRTGLWIEDAARSIAPDAVHQTARIGVAYAGPDWSARPYRFLWSPRDHT